MNIGNSDILYSFDRARLIDRARNGFMRIDGLTFKRARDYMAKYSARDYLMQCPLDLSTKDWISGGKVIACSVGPNTRIYRKKVILMVTLTHFIL